MDDHPRTTVRSQPSSSPEHGAAGGAPLTSGEVYFQLLGPVRGWIGGREVSLGTPKQRVVLCLLLLARGNVIRTASIVDTLWDAEPPRHATNTVQVYVSRIRATLRPAGPGSTLPITTVTNGYRLDLPPRSTDYHLFNALREDAHRCRREGRMEDALKITEGALSLWRDEALLDFDDPLRERLKVHVMQRDYRASVLELAEMAGELGRPEVALPRLESLTDSAPTDETVHGSLMTIYAEVGRRAAALETYERVRAALASTLGIDPSEQLKETYLRVLRS